MTTTLESKPAVEAARSRVSKRKYTDKPLSHAEITHIVELAGKAPSSFNVQSWRFIAVVDPELKARIQAAAHNQPQVGAAAVLFVLTSDMPDAIARLDEVLAPAVQGEAREKSLAMIRGMLSQMSEEQQDAFGRGQAYIALGYLLLILESLGYASSPMLGFAPDQVREILGLHSRVEIPALVAVGHAAEDGYPQHRLPVSEILQIR